MAAGYNDGSLWIFDTDSGRPVIPPMRGHRGAMEASQFSPDGHRIASADVNRTVRVWNADTGQPIAESRPEHTDTIVQLVFSPDGRRLLSTSSDNTMRLWDTDSDAFVGKPLSGFESYFSRVAFSPDGQRLVSLSAYSLRPWDTRNWQLVGKPHLSSNILRQFGRPPGWPFLCHRRRHAKPSAMGHDHGCADWESHARSP